MPVPDEERFEAYLREFRPLAAEPMRGSVVARQDRWLVAGACAVAAAAALAVLGLYPWRAGSRSHTARPSLAHELPRAPEALTMGTANAVLTKSASFGAAIDALVFPLAATYPKSPNSALAVLSKEENKL